MTDLYNNQINNNYPYPLLLERTGAAKFAYSLRKLNPAYTGNCIRLRRSSDNAEMDFGFYGILVDTAAIGNWLAGASGYVVTWYDQSGNGNNAIQSTASLQPLYTAVAQDGKPGVTFDGADDTMSVSGYTPNWNAIDFTYSVAAILTSASDVFRGLLSNRFGAGSGNWFTVGRDTSANDLSVEFGPASGVSYASSAIEPIAAGAKVTTFKRSGTNGTIYVDSVEKETQDITSRNLGGATNNLVIGTWLAAGQNWAGHMFEMWLCESALGAASLGNGNGDMMHYWGV